MNLNALISAADFLYTHSPAPYVTEKKNTILVIGRTGDALAEALYDLLFSTACRRGTELRLFRLCSEGAEQQEFDFVCRNEKGIGAFAHSEHTPEEGSRPLTVRFFDYADPEWRREPERFAYAVNLDAGAVTVPGVPCFLEIPLLTPREGRWTAADEAHSAMLRAARRVHTAYTAGWNSRYRESEILSALYGPEADPSYYCLRSSIRFAVSIPWKLAACGVYPGRGAAEALYGKLSRAGGRAVDALAWQEHRSWMAFMVLEGWSMPSPEQMREYLFRNGNDHRDLAAKLHPCLCDLFRDDWNEPRSCLLSRTPSHAWSKAYARMEDYGQLDQISLLIHHLCKERTLSPAYGEEMRGLFRRMETALIQSGMTAVEEHIQRSQRMENMFARMRNNETHSYYPWLLACRGFLAGLEREDAAAAAEARQICGEIMRLARVAEERNKYIDYREMDQRVIRWLPWIISGEKVRTVWKLYARSNRLSNLLSSIILRPDELNLICSQEEIAKAPAEAFRELLARHGTGETRVNVLPASAWKDGTVPAGPEDVIDVTDCGEMRNWLRFPADARVVFYAKNDLQDAAGSRFFAPLFHPYDFSMTVTEVIGLKGHEILLGEGNNDMLGMEGEYEDLWSVSREIKHLSRDRSGWREVIDALRTAEAALEKKAYPRAGSARGRRFRYEFSEEEYARLTRNGAVGVLHDLQERNCLSELYIGPRELSCLVFPGPDGDCAGTEQALAAMLGDPSPDSEYALVDDYVSAGKPWRFLNRKEPILLDTPVLSPEQKKKTAKGIKKLAEKGLLIPAAGENRYFYKSLAVRRELEKEGFALEAYTYYSLFLSDRFDDVRSNVRVKTGVGASGGTLEKELDILVTRKGRMGLISCKDTANVSLLHIGEIKMQSNLYGISARPILVCSEALSPEIEELCGYVGVGLITRIAADLPARIARELEK